MYLHFPQSEEENISLAAIAGSELSVTFAPPFIALASLSEEGNIAGVVVLNNYDSCNIDLTAVGRGAFSLGVVRAICTHVFDNLGCSRITAKTRKSNKVVRRLLGRHAKFEATLKNWFGNEDALQFRMCRDECPWLEKKNGIDTFASRAA